MNPKPLVEVNLKRARSRWRRLRLLQHSSTLAALVCAILLLLAWALVSGWTVPPWVVKLCIGLFAAGILVTWIIIATAVATNTPARNWLAALLESGHAPLQDRLNTLVHLEKPARRNTLLRSFYHRIAAQTHNILAHARPDVPLAARRPLIHFWIALAVVIGTIWVYDHYSPWKRYMAAYHERLHAKSNPPAVAETAPELALPTNNIAEQKQAWGEVRITDPARDLQVTKVDVVPLHIEAAATDPIQKVGWSSTINGRSEKQHELPAPPEPRFAAYKSDVYLDEMRLADWDVVTYYAKANTDNPAPAGSFASEVYFLEVRPFREDILKLPGGEGGQAYQCLNELTALITRQQHIIRQTHQHVQTPPPQPNLEMQDRLKLAEAETDLGDSTKHLYAKMATEMENKPIGEALDQLAKAEGELGKASKALTDNVFPEAQNRERSALTELVAARKIFQKVVSENPSAFEDERKEDPQQSSAEDQQALKEIAEYRNQAKAAADLLAKTLIKERDIAEKARTQSRTNYVRLAGEQRVLQSSLQQFQEQNPGAFKNAQSQFNQATNTMKRTADALARQNSNARTNAQQAVQSLEELRAAMQQKSADRQLADAHKLKQMLDRQVQTMQECQNSADGLTSEVMQGAATQAQQTVQELKKATEQNPTREEFGSELQKALSNTNVARINQQLSNLKQAQTPEQRKEAAGEAGRELAKVSQAFEKSLPDALQAGRKTDSLKPDPGESLERGLAQLDSLIKQLEKQNSKDGGKQGQEALYNLQTGMRDQYGSNERGNQILMRLEKALKPGDGPEVADLKKLMDELQKFSVEMKTDLAKKEENVEVTNIDPARLPPAYRGRIQKYFQKLSEK
jgi:hypothetical protein